MYEIRVIYQLLKILYDYSFATQLELFLSLTLSLYPCCVELPFSLCFNSVREKLKTLNCLFVRMSLFAGPAIDWLFCPMHAWIDSSPLCKMKQV